MNNREWLYSLDVADLADWFDAEHAEQHEGDELEAFAKRLERAAHDKLGVTLFGVDYVTEEFMLHVRDTLTAERDALADDLLTCNKEREQYRELFSQAITQAAEIVNLQP